MLSFSFSCGFPRQSLGTLSSLRVLMIRSSLLSSLPPLSLPSLSSATSSSIPPPSASSPPPSTSSPHSPLSSSPTAEPCSTCQSACASWHPSALEAGDCLLSLEDDGGVDQLTSLNSLTLSFFTLNSAPQSLCSVTGLTSLRFACCCEV